MKDISKTMDFDVVTDLKNPSTQYNIIVDLESEVEPNAREMAIALAGTVVRNNCKNLYGKLLDHHELADVIKDKLNTWIPKESGFKATRVVTSLKVERKRA